MIKFIDMTGKTEDEAIRRALEQLGLERDDVSVEILERAKSGFLGMTGMADCRKVMEGEAQGDARCALAMKVFYHQAKKIIGSLIAEMNGCDALVFTAGIGENDPVVRANICRDLDYLGIEIDEAANASLKRGTAGDITGKNSRVKVLVIPTDEEYMIAKETLDIVTK